MKKRFDELFYRTIPLVLFSTVKARKEYGDVLSSLFIMLETGDTPGFKEIDSKLVKKLANPPDHDRHQNARITAFENRYLSLGQRIDKIEETYFDFQSMVEQIKNDHYTLNHHGKRIHSMGMKISTMKRPPHEKGINLKTEEIMKRPPQTEEELQQGKINPLCPICGTRLYGKGKSKYGGHAYYCKENNRYKHWFRTDDNGNFFYCKKCSSVMLGIGKKLRCSNDKCDYKEKVV